MTLLAKPIQTSVTIHMTLTTVEDRHGALKTFELINSSLGRDKFVTHVTGLANVPGSPSYKK